VAFCLFGCPLITEESNRLINFTTGGEIESKCSARKVTRQKDECHIVQQRARVYTSHEFIKTLQCFVIPSCWMSRSGV
jgi:hypothetical protein